MKKKKMACVSKYSLMGFQYYLSCYGFLYRKKVMDNMKLDILNAYSLLQEVIYVEKPSADDPNPCQPL